MDLNQNYFSLFNLPQQFTIDQNQLADKFRQLQREVHPDRHVGKGKHQQFLAMQFASHVNTAYQTLKSPLPRAEYLLELAEMPVNKETTTVADADFLFQQMQWRDTLSEAVNQQCEQTLSELLSTVTAQGEKLLLEFNRAYDAKNFVLAKEAVAKLHFIEKMMSEIKQVKFSKAVDNSNPS